MVDMVEPALVAITRFEMVSRGRFSVVLDRGPDLDEQTEVFFTEQKACNCAMCKKELVSFWHNDRRLSTHSDPYVRLDGRPFCHDCSRIYEGLTHGTPLYERTDVHRHGVDVHDDSSLDSMIRMLEDDSCDHS